MSWKIRRHGAVQLVEGLTLAQVVEGLHDGYWDPVDEVMGPQDQEWVRIEDHPQLEDVAVELGPISHLSEDEARVDGRASVDDLSELFDTVIAFEDEDEYDTVGGLIYHRIGGIPSPGDRVEVDGLTLTVESTDGRRVGKVLVVRTASGDELEADEDGDR